MPFPGSVGSVWAPNTWGTDTWTEDSWDGAEVAPIPPPSTGSGGWHGTEDDVEAIERLLHQRGRVRAIARPGVVHAHGTVVNPVPKPKERPKPVPVVVVPPPPPEPRHGEVVCIVFPTCSAVGSVGLGTKDEAVAVAAALSDPLYDWLVRELGL